MNKVDYFHTDCLFYLNFFLCSNIDRYIGKWGLHFLLRLDTRESDGALRDRAAALGVRLGFLSEYAAIPSPAYAHTLVVNYAGLSPAALPEAMDLLAEIFGA